MIRGRSAASLVVALLGVAAGLWLLSAGGAADAPWLPGHSRQATAQLAGHRVLVRNVRDFRYPADRQAIEAWDDREFDLSALDSLWLGVSDMPGPRALAHLFLSFGFADGRYLVVSVEARRRVGQTYSALRGLLGTYELIFVVADERDFIASRANKNGRDVWLYPLRADPERARALLVEVLEFANRLAAEPVYYNTVRRSCSTMLLRLANRVRERPLRGGWRILLPGYTDSLMLDLGLVESDLELEEARARYLVSERSRRFGEDPEYSARLREGR